MPLTAISVLGAGSWGTALAVLLARNGRKTLLWGRNRNLIAEMQKTRVNESYLPGQRIAREIALSASLEYAVKNSDILVLAVPTSALGKLSETIAPWLTSDRGKYLVVTSKGIDSGSGRFPYQILRDTLGPKIMSSFLRGPSFAMEVALDKPTAVTFAAPELETARTTGKYFSNRNFRVYLSTDVIGVEVASALKNVLAIAAGIADGLELGANARAALITRGISEIARLALDLGGSSETLYGLSGIGDLVLSCCDDQSRNRRFGLLLARGEEKEKAISLIGTTVEGAATAQSIRRLADQRGLDMPICAAVADAVSGLKSPADAVADLLARKNEISADTEN